MAKTNKLSIRILKFEYLLTVFQSKLSSHDLNVNFEHFYECECVIIVIGMLWNVYEITY